MSILPSPSLLNQINQFIQGGEFSLNCGLFLLSWKSGLRVSEAVSFDYNSKHLKYKGLYLVNGKGNKTRYVYVSKEVISELKKQNWKPNQTNRFAFNNFLKRVKEKMNIGKNIELTPHTLRRCFTTYNALKGVPMPILQKLLGHKNIRTTSYYWKGSASIREFGGWLEFPSKQSEPDETPQVKISDNYQLPKISEIPVKLEKPNLNSGQESEKSENLKTISKLKEQLAQKDLVIAEKDRQIQSITEDLSKVENKIQNKDSEIQQITKLSKESKKQISLLTSENEKLKAIKQIKGQKLKELQAEIKAIENSTNLKNAAENKDKNQVNINQIQIQPSRRKITPKVWLNSRENSFKTVLSKRSGNQFTELLDKGKKENSSNALSKIKKPKNNPLVVKKKAQEQNKTQEKLIAEIQVWKKK